MPVIPEFRRRGREDPEVRTVWVTQLGWGQTEPREVSSKNYYSFYSVSCLGECFQSLQIWFTPGHRNAWHGPFTQGDFTCLTVHCINQFQYYTSLRVRGLKWHKPLNLGLSRFYTTNFHLPCCSFSLVTETHTAGMCLVFWPGHLEQALPTFFM